MVLCTVSVYSVCDMQCMHIQEAEQDKVQCLSCHKAVTMPFFRSGSGSLVACFLCPYAR